MLGDLTPLTVYTTIGIFTITVVIRYLWRRGKDVEEP
jgi:hypothetical protein